MANPPITIGPFTNVPAPGSGIRSDWAQQITQHVVDRGGKVLALVERTTSAGPQPSGTPVAIGGMSVPLTLTATRKVRVSAYVRHAQSDTNGGYGGVEIRNQSNGIYADGLYTCFSCFGVNLSGAIHVSRIVTLAAGSYTLSLWMNPAGGNCTLAAAGNSPMWLAAEDLGI